MRMVAVGAQHILLDPGSKYVVWVSLNYIVTDYTLPALPINQLKPVNYLKSVRDIVRGFPTAISNKVEVGVINTTAFFPVEILK